MLCQAAGTLMAKGAAAVERCSRQAGDWVDQQRKSRMRTPPRHGIMPGSCSSCNAAHGIALTAGPGFLLKLRLPQHASHCHLGCVPIAADKSVLMHQAASP